jgi:hypothetical protein
MYKRVLDSTENKRSKGPKISKKLVDLICVICGDHAIGFNYDLLTCASCKAFFRRNAQYNPVAFEDFYSFAFFIFIFIFRQNFVV